MKQFKMLYKVMYDDLKDADMIIDYAYEIREKNQELADEFAKYALERLAHFDGMHKIFLEEAKEIEINKETVGICLWEVTHEHIQEWYHSIKSKIKDY